MKRPTRRGSVKAAAAVSILAVAMLIGSSLVGAAFAHPGISNPPSSTLRPGFWYVGASSSDPESLSNTGARSIIQVEKQNISGVLSFWISEGMSNNLWAQVGYYMDNGSSLTAFYQVWNLTSMAELATGIGAVSEGMHVFSLSLGRGTTWDFEVDGSALGSFDMRTNTSSASYPIRSMSEEGYVSSPFAFSQVTFLNGMEVEHAGVWSSAQNATSFGSIWGIQGSLQSATITGNGFVVGGSAPRIAQGTLLWS